MVLIYVLCSLSNIDLYNTEPVCNTLRALAKLGLFETGYQKHWGKAREQNLRDMYQCDYKIFYTQLCIKHKNRSFQSLAILDVSPLPIKSI